MRVVLDTNTLVSAVLSPLGPPRRLLDDARAQVFELCSSPVLMAELLDVVSREKFAKRTSGSGAGASGHRRRDSPSGHLAVPADVPRVVTNDADDDHVLACASPPRPI